MGSWMAYQAEWPSSAPGNKDYDNVSQGITSNLTGICAVFCHRAFFADDSGIRAPIQILSRSLDGVYLQANVPWPTRRAHECPYGSSQVPATLSMQGHVRLLARGWSVQGIHVNTPSARLLRFLKHAGRSHQTRSKLSQAGLYSMIPFSSEDKDSWPAPFLPG